MNTALSPMVSEFETIEQENSYNEWLRAKVAASLANPRPAIPMTRLSAEWQNALLKCARNGVSSKCYPCYGLKAQIPT